MSVGRLPPVVGHAVDLAEAAFGPNLRLVFVGGSYARRTHGPISDVDLFVLLRRPDEPAERWFAAGLRGLHERAGLTFDHCGELFDQSCLDELLAFTERCVGRLPAIQQLACYQADCLLSVFRKGDVVFKFLADPKVCIAGDTDYLAALERRAAAFFDRFPMRRVQQRKGLLDLPAGTTQATMLATFTDRLNGEDWPDTPVGIGLGRWFTNLGLPARQAGDHPQPVSAPAPEHRCPLPAHPAASDTGRVLRSQCLAHGQLGAHGNRTGPPISTLPSTDRPGGAA